MFLIHDINVLNMQFSILVRLLKIIRIIIAQFKQFKKCKIYRNGKCVSFIVMFAGSFPHV